MDRVIVTTLLALIAACTSPKHVVAATAKVELESDDRTLLIQSHSQLAMNDSSGEPVPFEGQIAETGDWVSCTFDLPDETQSPNVFVCFQVLNASADTQSRIQSELCKGSPLVQGECQMEGLNWLSKCPNNDVEPVPGVLEKQVGVWYVRTPSGRFFDAYRFMASAQSEELAGCQLNKKFLK